MIIVTGANGGGPSAEVVSDEEFRDRMMAQGVPEASIKYADGDVSGDPSGRLRTSRSCSS